MIDQLIKDITNTLKLESTKLQGLAGISEAQLKGLVESALKRCNLVTREEFEVQEAVLKRSREKIDAMEQTIAMLEQQLKTD